MSGEFIGKSKVMLSLFQKPQSPDLWHSNFLPDLLKVLKPSVTVEIGIAQGESAKTVSKASRQVFATDIDPEPAKRLSIQSI